MKLSQLCTPAMIYFVLSVLSLVISAFYQLNIASILIQLLFIALWTWLLNFFCEAGYSVLSWVIVFFPFIMAALLLLNLVKK
jgi:Na+/melibiose symporter-like transporter